MDAFDPARQFYAWFYVLLRNRCFEQRSRRATRWEGGTAAMRGVDPGLSEAHVDLWRAIERLAPDDAELIVLKHIEGWTYEELAKALGVPRGTVMSRLMAPAPADLWPAVEARLRDSEVRLAPARMLWPIGATVLLWRASERCPTCGEDAPWNHPSEKRQGTRW